MDILLFVSCAHLWAVVITVVIVVTVFKQIWGYFTFCVLWSVVTVVIVATVVKQI